MWERKVYKGGVKIESNALIEIHKPCECLMCRSRNRPANTNIRHELIIETPKKYLEASRQFAEAWTCMDELPNIIVR